MAEPFRLQTILDLSQTRMDESARALAALIASEHDQSRKTSDYSASGVAALQPIDFGSNPKKTRPVASIGGIYDVDKTHQFSAQWVYRKEAFSSSATNSLLATYSMGF